MTNRPIANGNLRRGIPAAALIGVPLLVIAIALLLTQQVSRADRLYAAERQSQERRALLQAVLSAHQDIETGQRGYLLTGRAEFLEPRVAGDRRVRSAVASLRSAYVGDRASLAVIDQIDGDSRAKRRFVERTIARRAAGDPTGATALVNSGRGKRLMDALRLRIAGLLDAEQRQLAAMSVSTGHAIAGLRWVTYGLLALVLLILAAAARTIASALRSRDEALTAAGDLSRRRKAILDSAMDAIVTLNPSGSIEGCNRAAVRMFGYPEADLMRRDVGMLFATPTPIGSAAALLREMNLQEGAPGKLQQIIGRRKDGTTFPTDVAITVTHLAEGLRYVAVVRDITERDRVDQMKTEFISTVSHELRTPLTSIAGSLGLLAGGAAGTLEPKAERLITIARNNADRLVRLINDILDIEKIQSGQIRFDTVVLDLREAVGDAVEANRGYGDRLGIRFELALPDATLPVLADRDRLAQVFANLLSNAAKFSPPDQAVTVLVEALDQRYRVTVRDRGPGIPNDFRSRIFGKFAQADSSDTRQKGGTGLGLSIVKEIVARLGGEVSFDSVEGQGTAFHVDLPRAEVEPVGELGQPVLIVSDGHTPELDAKLRSKGLRPVIANSADAAAAQLQRERYRAALVDISLGTMDTVIRAARSAGPNLHMPIVAIGGEPRDGEVPGAPALIVDWLHDAIPATDIAERLKQAIGTTGKGRCRVLHVDDDPDVLRVVAAALEHAADVTSSPSLATARSALQASEFDLVILDLTLGDGRGSELFPDLQRAGQPPVPVVAFSAEDPDSHTASQFQHFLTKGRTPLEHLVQVIVSVAQTIAPAQRT